MNLNIYAVYDRKAEAYMNPFHAPLDGMAIRMFSQSVNDPQTMLSKYPDDFTLYRIGTFDDQTGMYTQEDHHKYLGTATQFKTETPVDMDKVEKMFAKIEKFLEK